MTQGWWAAVRLAATVALAALTAAQLYYPHVPWISIAVLTLATLGVHVFPTNAQVSKVTVAQPQVPPVTYGTGGIIAAHGGGGGGLGGQPGATGGNGK